MSPADLDAHAIAVLALAAGAFVLFSRERVPLETTSFAVLVLLTAGFQLFPYESHGVRLAPIEFFAGFGHEALVAICALMILGRGLAVTGALEPVSRVLGRLLEASPSAAMLVVLVLCALASGVMNDTPIVVLMLPILISASLRARVPASRSLLPMNYAVLIGGMGTTIGTSTNLLVVSIAADLGVRRFGMFDFIHVTALAAVGGILYLWLVLPRLLPERGALLQDTAPQVFSAVFLLAEDGFAVGQPLADVRQKLGAALRIVRIVRGDSLELARLPTLTLRAGDRIYVDGTASALREAAGQIGARLHSVGDEERAVDDEHPLAAEGQQLAEVAVTEFSPLNGATLRQTRFADHHDVVILGLHRARDHRLLRREDDIGDVVLCAGDLLLVQGAEETIRKLKARARLLVLNQTYEVPRTEKAALALLILAAVVALAALKLAPISVAATAGVLAMILTRCLQWEDAAGALSAKVILLVAASLALGAALERTGATAWLANAIVGATGGLSTEWLLALLMLLMALLTNFVSNNAAAAVGTPIAVNMAAALGVAPEPLVLAVMFGANFCYVTPMAYQTNLLVMSAAGYRFSDFVRGGLPLLVIMLASYALLLPRFFPF